MEDQNLIVNEIFKSIQGESSYAGIPCVFIRLTGCNLRCSYCDTAYAYEEGVEMPLKEIIGRIESLNCKNVCITGGEPLLQDNVNVLANYLKKNGYKIFIETNGSVDIDLLSEDAIRIMDVKCPDSGMDDKMDWNNIDRLKATDEVKFVISSKNDYEWAKDILIEHGLARKSNVLLGVVFGKVEPRLLAEWILQDNLDVRLQLQLQKYIWPDKARGV